MKRALQLAIAFLLAAGSALPSGAAQAESLNFTPYRANGIYALGEKLGWTVTAAPGSPATAGSYNYTVATNNWDVIAKGSFDLSSGTATIETSVDHPAMVYVSVDRAAALPSATVTPAEAAQVNDSLKTLLAKNYPNLKAIFDKHPGYCIVARPCTPGGNESVPMPPSPHLATLGAAVDPTGLRPSVTRPADFDQFWATELAQLKKIPINPILVRIATSQPGVKVYQVQLDSVGSHVHGYLAVPDRPGRFPAMIIYQWAGVYALDPSWAANRAAEGWLCYDVDSHDLPPNQATGVPQDYPTIGDTSRETSYFLNMYLRDTRALDYVTTLPHWNRKTIVLTGTSMGGQQSLVTAGLNPGRVTDVVVNEPSGADTNAALHGRQPAYPNWPVSDPRVAHTALYFDPVNFAAQIRAPVLVGIGLKDTVATPAGIWTAVNQIPGPKEVVPMVEADHNNLTPDKIGAFLQRSEEVFATILNGRPFVPNLLFTRSGT
jgi:cephalosporin-C deacetylase